MYRNSPSTVAVLCRPSALRRLAGVALLALAMSASILPAAGPAAAAPLTAATPSATSGGCNISTPSSAYAQQAELSAGHARVWRMYQAFFLRQPDRAGFDYWIRVRSQGAGLSDIAYIFSTGREFTQRYGRLDNGRFVDLVYRNVLCRTPDAGGRAYWLGLLNRGQLSRWDMVINFVEGTEYLRRTSTCHSFYPANDDTVPGCIGSLRSLGTATLSRDGYRARNVAVSRVRGGTGSFQGVEVDYRRGVFETGNDRCSVASINANWTVAAQKDRPDPAALGLGVVDGRHVKGSSDRADRGIIGLRFDSSPTDVVQVWPGDTKSPDDLRLSSVLWHQGRASLESWHAAAETSPYLHHQAPQEIVAPHEWAWAAAGVPLRVDGQTNPHFPQDYANDPYTHQTLRHPFVAFDQDTGRLIFGATANLDTRDLVRWAETSGYEDLVKFDGGGSAEFNVNRSRVVAGTSRDLPVWLGIGC